MDMRDFISGLFFIASTYFGSVVFTVVLFRLFFPLKTKVVGQNKLTFKYSGNNENSSTKNEVRVLSMRGRSDWVKINS
jgi:hypothetical protein